MWGRTDVSDLNSKMVTLVVGECLAHMRKTRERKRARNIQLTRSDSRILEAARKRLLKCVEAVIKKTI